jgi:hypothetical protein
MHHLKYAQYIEKIGAGLKSNPRCFFKFANFEQNNCGYSLVMSLGYTCARNTQKIANLFGEYFQGVYMRDDLQEDFVVDDGIEDYSTLSLIQLEGSCGAGYFGFGHTKGPWTRRDISTDSEKRFGRL